MKLTVQRVNRASVTVLRQAQDNDGKIVGKIGKGYLVLLGVRDGDGQEDVNAMVDKLIKLRIMSDDSGKMNLSIKDVGGEVLVISQFTLYADTSKGNRPSFEKAAKPEVAEDLYKYFISKLEEKGVIVETGKFGAHMVIDVTLDGPVTIELTSDKR